MEIKVSIQYEFSESWKYQNPTVRQRKLQPMKKEDDLVHKSSKPTIHGYFGEWSICSIEKLIPESVTETGERIPQKFMPKEPSDFSDTEKDKVALDTSLQLIVVESLDTAMLNQVINCSNAKQMWDTIELLMEGITEVKENRLDILTSQYEAFKSLPRESITQVFERYNKLLNDLNLHGKVYTSREVNRKFMLTLPSHLEHKISSIRERDDINEMSIERLYGKLKTHEMEQEQRQIIYGPGKVDK